MNNEYNVLKLAFERPRVSTAIALPIIYLKLVESTIIRTLL